MKKLYVNCPVKGRKWDDVVATINKMHKIAEIVFGEELAVIDTLSLGNLEDESLYSLAKHVEALAEADYAVELVDFNRRKWMLHNHICSIARGFGKRTLRVFSNDVAPDLSMRMENFTEDDF